jgi:hypothetical protein
MDSRREILYRWVGGQQANDQRVGDQRARGGRAGVGDQETPLRQALAGAQFAETHRRVVSGAPEQVWEALHDLRWRELRASRPLIAARKAAAGPSALSGSLGSSRSSGPRRDLDRRLVDPPSPAVPLYEESPWFSTSGMIGRPWTPRPTPGPAVASLEELRKFHEPGWLKYGMEWVLSPVAGNRTLVETTTLCEATDAHALRRFAAYWLVIRGFSGLIRRDILAALARRLG